MKIKMTRSKEVNVLSEKPKSLELKLRQCLTENAEMQTWVITPIRGGSACHLAVTEKIAGTACTSQR